MDVASGDTSLRRLAWVGPATIVVSVLAVSVVRATIVALIPLDSWAGSIMASHEPEVVTGVLVTAAVVMFPVVVTIADDHSWNPSLTFRRVALGVLVASCIPNIAAPISEGRIADGGMLQLMVLHVVAWAVTVRMLDHALTVSPTVKHPEEGSPEGPHGNEQGHTFRLSLIHDPRFAGLVNDIVVEFGSASNQDIMDRFVNGADIPMDRLRMVWQNTTQPTTVWDRPIYGEFFRAVRDVNQSLPSARRLRVLLVTLP